MKKFSQKSFKSKKVSFKGSSTGAKKERSTGKKVLLGVAAFILVLIAVFAIVLTINNNKKDKVGNQVLNVSISALPKQVYYVGDEPSYTGLKITTTFYNGTSFTEGEEACTFEGFNSEFPVAEQQIFVTYGEHSFVYTVEIKERPRPASPLQSISIDTLPKTEYKVGDWLDVNDGVLLLTYENGDTRKIRLEPSHINTDSFNTKTPGNYTVEVLILENDVIKSCTYDVTVTE